MLIKNIQTVDNFKLFKQKIYQFTKKVNGSFNFETFSLAHLFLTHFALLFPFISVLFKRTDYFPSISAQIFRLCLFTNLSQSFSISTNAVYIGCIAFNMLMLTVVAAHFIFDSVFTTVTKIFSLTLKLLQYLIVPFVDLAFTGYLDMLNPNNDISLSLLGALTFFSSLATTAVVLLSLKFEIRFLRKKNIFWNLDNDVHFYGILYLVFKTIIITTTDVSTSLCLLSLVVWFYHRQLSGGCIGKQQKIIEYSIYNYVAAADFSVLAFLLFGDSKWALGLWFVLLLSSLLYCISTLSRQKIDKLHLPPCDQGSEQFYHFFFSFRQSFKGDETHKSASTNAKYERVHYLHKAACKSKNCFLGAVHTNDYAEMEELINRVIQTKSKESIKDWMVCQLWNLQMGKKCSIQALIDKPAHFKQDFVIYSIEKLSKDTQVTLRNSESNKGIISKVFYDLIYEISSYYSQFYSELGSTHPKIDVIVDYGTKIRSKIELLKSAYSDLLKSKLINFRMIQLYLEFMTNFIGQNALDNDDVERLSKAQQSIYFEDISESYLPTLSLYLETGNIENANSQAQKLLHSTRFELKYKNIADITQPSITINNLKQILTKEKVDAKSDPFYSFFLQSENSYGFTSVAFEQRLVKQKKVMVMQMTRLKFSDQKNYFLVFTDFALKIMLRRSVKVKSGGFRAHPLILDWTDLYSQYILTNLTKIISSKMVKIPTAVKNCIIVVKRLRCLVEGYFILEAQMFVASQPITKNRSSILMLKANLQQKKIKQQLQFRLGFNEQDQKLAFYVIKGSMNSLKFDQCTTLAPEYQQIQNDLVASIIEEKGLEYGKDIRTYRLYQGELYNVDLEDREAYNNLFDRHIWQKKRVELSSNSPIQCYIFVAVVILGLLLVALSLTLIVQFEDTSNSIRYKYTQFMNIESLMIDFKRILCLLRDYASGFMSNFANISLQDELGVSYSRIQNLKNQVIFPNDVQTIQFQSLTVSGNLIELVDVMLAHITESLGNGNMSIIQDIRNTTIGQLNGMIGLAQADIYSQLLSQLNSISLLSSIVLYCSLGVVLLLYILMVFYCFKSNSQLKQSLSSLLFMTDAQANMHRQNAERLKYAVEMIRKNFEVDSQNLLVGQSDSKRRKNPKDAILSKQIIYSIAVMAVVGLAVHLGCLLLFETQFKSQLAAFRTMKDQAISTTTIYHTSAQLSNYIDHTGAINNEMLSTIKGNLSYLEYNMNGFLFSPTLSSFLGVLYFGNSCSLLAQRYNLSASECSNTTPGFTVTNPFQIGLAIYLNRQTYYLFNNLTEDFAHTGVYSGPFVSILTNLTEQYKTESLEMMGRIGGSVNVLNSCIIAIDLAYLFAFMVVYYYFHSQLTKIKDILTFFDSKFKVDRPLPPEKQEIEIRDQDQGDSSSEEDRSLLASRIQQDKYIQHLAGQSASEQRPQAKPNKLPNHQPLQNQE